MISAMLMAAGCIPTERQRALVVPEQHCLDIRAPQQLPAAGIEQTPPPETVSNRRPPNDTRNFSLDEAIRLAITNTKVIVSPASVAGPGLSIYDAAISNAAIDEARAVFDPVISARNNFSRVESPNGFVDPLNPFNAAIIGDRIDNYELGLGVTKKNIYGGTVGLDFVDDISHTNPGPAPLSPQDRSGLTLSYTQPLAQGAGAAANLAPIIIARINTERSFFQYKDGLQDVVRGVIEAYWQVVFARTDVWARQQQVLQGQAAVLRAEARQRQGFANVAELAQAKVALANFKATLIASEANLLRREGELRAITNLPASEPWRFMPTTPPTPIRMEPKWDELLQLAAERRPDIIELKLIIEADQQNLVIARNQAQPKIDATLLYRWNGLEGLTPARDRLSTGPGQFTDWTAGVSFSVPLGLRASRAGLRRSELLLVKDNEQLDQGLLTVSHTLASNVRNLAQYYEQYRAYAETRTAARVNLEQQVAEFRAGRSIFLNVLQAITNWGDAVSAEAQSLALYNIELANLERQTGTILETHGIWMAEERYRSLGPLGRFGDGRCYPKATNPNPNADRYPTTTEPAEKALERELPSFKIEPPPAP